MGMMTPKSQDDVIKAFDFAISKGAFTKEDAMSGDLMYMYRKDDIYYFKNKHSKKYITIPL